MWAWHINSDEGIADLQCVIRVIRHPWQQLSAAPISVRILAVFIAPRQSKSCVKSAIANFSALETSVLPVFTGFFQLPRNLYQLLQSFLALSVCAYTVHLYHATLTDSRGAAGCLQPEVFAIHIEVCAPIFSFKAWSHPWRQHSSFVKSERQLRCLHSRDPWRQKNDQRRFALRDVSDVTQFWSKAKSKIRCF